MIALITMIFICSQTCCRQLRQDRTSESLGNNVPQILSDLDVMLDLEEGKEPSQEEQLFQSDSLDVNVSKSPYTESTQENDLEESKYEAPEEEGEEEDNSSEILGDFVYNNITKEFTKILQKTESKLVQQPYPQTAQDSSDGGSKKGGDNSRLALSLVLVAVVIAALVVGIIVVRRRKTNDRHGYQVIEMTTTTTKMD